MSREWTAKWIGPETGDQSHPVIFKDFYIDDEIKKATLYITSLGIFEAYVNGQRVGGEYLTPYQTYEGESVQYFSFDVTELLNCGPESEANSIDVFLGRGWNDEEDRFAVKAEFEIEVYKNRAEELNEEPEEQFIEEEPFSEEEQFVEEEPFSEEEQVALDEPIVEEEPLDEEQPIADEAPLEEVIEEAAEEFDMKDAIEEAADEFDMEDAIEEAADEFDVEDAINEAAAEEFDVEDAIDEAVSEAADEMTFDEEEFDEIFNDDFLEDVIKEEQDEDTIFEDLEEDRVELLAMKGDERIGEANAPFELDDLNDLDDFLERVIDTAPKAQDTVQTERRRNVGFFTMEDVNTKVEETKEIPEAPEEEETESVTHVPTIETADEVSAENEDDDLEIFDFEDWDDEEHEPEVEKLESPNVDLTVAPYSITDEELEAMFDAPLETEEAVEETVAEPEFAGEAFEEDDLAEAIDEAEDDLFSEETLDSLLDETLFPEAEAEEIPEAAEEESEEDLPEAIEEEVEAEEVSEAAEEESEEDLPEAIEEEMEAEELLQPAEDAEEELPDAVEEEAEAEEIPEDVEAVEEELPEEVEAEEEPTALEVGLAAAVADMIGDDTDTLEAELPEETETIIIGTDETWGYYASDIEYSSIHTGEVFNRLLWEDEDNPEKSVEVLDIDIPLTERYALPVIVKERLDVKDVIPAEDGTAILDFGKSFSGFVTFNSSLPKGTIVRMNFAEDFAEDAFEDENELSGFTYISDGMPEVVGPHFTYFTGRYVKVSGWEGDIDPKDFIGCAIYSDLKRTGFVATSNERLDAIYEDLLAGQQRTSVVMPEEGEPADVFVYAPAASYNMDIKAFLMQYLKGLGTEPADDKLAYAPQIIWNLYQMYGDEAILSENYELMKAWTDHIDAKDSERGDKHFLYDFDTDTDAWVSMDQETETEYIASACYYEATRRTAEAAAVLGKEQDAFRYSRLARRIKQAFLEEYYTGAGRLSVDTQTAYVLALQFGLYVDQKRVAEGLKKRLAKDGGTLKCAPAAAPFICKVLADNGMTEKAYDILLDENKKSFNNEVEFIYAYMAGIKPLEPGFSMISLAPVPDGRVNFCMSSFESPVGTIVSNWTINEEGALNFHFEVPEGATAKIALPYYPVCAAGGNEVIVKNGSYDYTYMPSVKLK